MRAPSRRRDVVVEQHDAPPPPPGSAGPSLALGAREAREMHLSASRSFPRVIPAPGGGKAPTSDFGRAPSAYAAHSRSFWAKRHSALWAAPSSLRRSIPLPAAQSRHLRSLAGLRQAYAAHTRALLRQSRHPALCRLRQAYALIPAPGGGKSLTRGTKVRAPWAAPSSLRRSSANRPAVIPNATAARFGGVRAD